MRLLACAALLLGWASIAPAADAPASGDPFEDALWLRFNFIPGDQILFAEDFAEDTLGAAPRRLTLASGRGVIEEWSDARYLRIDEPTVIELGMNEALQRTFTIELDLGLTAGSFDLEGFDPVNEGTEPEHIHLTASSGGIHRGGADDKSEPFEPSSGPLRVSLSAEIARARVWVNGKELADVTDSRFARSNQLRLRCTPEAGHPIRLGAIAVANISRPLQVARLKVEPSIVSHGILWKGDALRPESAPTLRWLVDSLRHDQSLRLRLTVNADGRSGDGTALLETLRQAKSLESYLRARGGVGPQQITVEGMGNRQRILPSDTPEARWLNRRVEIAKQ